KRGEPLITDYTFAKDALFARINLIGDELDMYYRVHEALAEKIPLPDLIVYLRADIEILMQRIASRDRPYERNMEQDYINQLILAYDDFFLNNQARNVGGNVAVLPLDTNELDYIRRAEDLRLVETKIRQSLKQVPFQATLPIIDDL
ncbi:MAG TPA: deoxynucleoside kinase, partial [Saprospiraceae bacterium]|nr:deoxynucleoside kinase [Saprospiraceae bacterium]